LPGIFAPLFLKKWPAGGIENNKTGTESAGNGTGRSIVRIFLFRICVGFRASDSEFYLFPALQIGSYPNIIIGGDTMSGKSNLFARHRPGFIQCFFIPVFLVFFTPELMAYEKDSVMVPMRDGIRLATYIYSPSVGEGSYPVILVRTPYSPRTTFDPVTLTLFTDMFQYALIVQNTRGRFQSEGADSLFLNDGWGIKQDGYDTIEWIAAQPWCNGKIGMWGASAFGITQYLAAGTAPPHLTCCLVMVAASDLYSDAIFQGGAFRKSLIEGWLEDNGSLHLLDFFRENPLYGPPYDLVNLAERFDSVAVPILHLAGWHDIFLQGQLNAFQGIRASGKPLAAQNQKILIGPWVHSIVNPLCGQLIFPGGDRSDLASITLNWFETWLKGTDAGAEQMPAVQYYLMGDAEDADSPGNRWVEAEEWPPQTEPACFYLRSGGFLSLEPPAANEPPEIYTYDPDNPVPTIGGRNLNIPAGSWDQSCVESRPDVLVYSTPPLTDSLTVIGRVRVLLWASSDALDTDFTAKLCDVYPDGRSMLVADGIIRARYRRSRTEETFLVPGQADTFSIDLWSTALVFAPGHAVRISISSSNYPRFDKNYNTGGDPWDPAGARPAEQTVYQDAQYASYLELPVLSGESPVLASDNNPPSAFTLEPNFPNPFNHETIIPVSVSGNGRVDPLSVGIYDITGRLVKSWDLTVSAAGQIRVTWKGDDERGRLLPSGIYICRLLAGNRAQSRKLMLVR
jgi:predicted acyl esterase